jgi:hypothetical protein
MDISSDLMGFDGYWWDLASNKGDLFEYNGEMPFIHIDLQLFKR